MDNSEDRASPWAPPGHSQAVARQSVAKRQLRDARFASRDAVDEIPHETNATSAAERADERATPTELATLSLSFDPSAYEALTHLAERNGQTVGEALRDALQFATDVAAAEDKGWRVLLERRGRVRVLRGARTGLPRAVLGA